ncbi:MAG: serine protease AprX [Actinomycetota bacterium]|nr:serine protease AprX [Actinomycetota bacterium]
MRASHERIGNAAGPGPSPKRAAARGVEWAHRRVALVASVATVASLGIAVPAYADAMGTAAVVGSAPASAPVTVLVTPAHRPDPYTSSDVGDPAAALVDASQRAAQTGLVGERVAAAGVIETDLPAVSGVVADVSPDQLATLKAQSDLVVTPNAPVAVQDASFPSALRAPAAVFPKTTGATTLWSNDVDGSGVAVAVLDTGITKLPDFGKRIIGGVDLSGEGNAFQDSYGHGTFVAGLIAGNGASSKGAYKGEAPGANLVSVKVAGASGVTDLATVISGINWVVTHRDQYGIRVLNISMGAIPTQSTVLNPLDQAVETAWQAGIAVVVSAGNAGPFNGTILSPGDDPLVITVGSLDDLGSTNPSNSVATTFGSVGPTNVDGWFKPDLVTSGRSVVSLRAPGSTIDRANPTARVGSANFVGSGTSFSAAITSGAAALLIEGAAQNSGKGKGRVLTSDEVKAQLLGTTLSGPVGNPMVDGHGALNVLGAVLRPGLELTQTVPTVPTPVDSDVDLRSTWALSSWNGSSWNGSSWNGSSWNGSSWNGSSWNGSSWNGSSWNGSSWNGSSWNGSSWNGSSWNGSSWNGSSWNGSTWR